MKFAESQLISMYAMVYGLLTQPYTPHMVCENSYTMANELYLRTHTPCAVPLISAVSVVQTFYLYLYLVNIYLVSVMEILPNLL